MIVEWREFRGLKQYELAEKIGMSTANLSRLETGVIDQKTGRPQGYTQENLEAIAVALRCRPSDLIQPFGPDSREHEIMALYGRLDEATKDKVLGYIQAQLDKPKDPLPLARPSRKRA